LSPVAMARPERPHTRDARFSHFGCSLLSQMATNVALSRRRAPR